MKIITRKIFQATGFDFPTRLSSTIWFENGVSWNFASWIKPNPIGEPITVIVNIPPIIKLDSAVKNPKNGKCHNILPNVLIVIFFTYNLEKFK